MQLDLLPAPFWLPVIRHLNEGVETSGRFVLTTGVRRKQESQNASEFVRARVGVADVTSFLLYCARSTLEGEILRVLMTGNAAPSKEKMNTLVMATAAELQTSNERNASTNCEYSECLTRR